MARRSDYMKYRKKPVVVEAIQLEWDDSNIDEIRDFVGRDLLGLDSEDKWFIETLEGKMRLCREAYVIKGVKGEFYPCDPEIFEQTYEKVD